MKKVGLGGNVLDLFYQLFLFVGGLSGLQCYQFVYVVFDFDLVVYEVLYVGGLVVFDEDVFGQIGGQDQCGGCVVVVIFFDYVIGYCYVFFVIIGFYGDVDYQVCEGCGCFYVIGGFMDFFNFCKLFVG